MDKGITDYIIANNLFVVFDNDDYKHQMTDLASSPLSEPLESTSWESNSTLMRKKFWGLVKQFWVVAKKVKEQLRYDEKEVLFEVW